MARPLTCASGFQRAKEAKMVNHPNRSENANTTWTIRFLEYFPVPTPGKLPQDTRLEFTGTRAEAIARYETERALKPSNVQVTLYRSRGEGRHGEGQRVREARGVQEG